MTRHDDSDLRLLERDLTALAAPRDDDERLRRTLRDELQAALRPQPIRRRFPRRVATATAAAIVAAAAVVLVATVGTNGSGGPAVASAAIVHHALAAVTPPANQILHTEVVGVQNGVTVVGETWQQTSPPYASRGIKGLAGHGSEFSDDGTTSYAYDPVTNTIDEQPDSSPPTFADPMSQIRAELARGQASVVGTVTIGGASLYKLALPHGVVGYFDQTDYRARYLDDPQHDGSVVRLRVAAYEYLPMTPDNRALLSVTAQHPRARIVVSSAAASAASGK
ncbi:MAG: hypothetical protein JO027_00370 [Solirubrobacterales bacterium]|nr:hypothetical protein [Solirubrobacterales bacterium]